MTDKTYFYHLVFDKKDHSEEALSPGEYDNCQFNNCNFANGNLSQIVFIDCTFTNCNLSGAKLQKTSFRDCTFKDCKHIGLHYFNCHDFLFAVTFENCNLNLASFYRMKIKKTHFKNCNLQEVDFTETDLSATVFENCDLDLAIFENTILEKADLRTAFNYSINPENNYIKKAKFSSLGLAGLLGQYDLEIE
jgi:fluoroquinolone resistance protein